LRAAPPNSERELRLKTQIGSELPIGPELDHWFSLPGIPDRGLAHGAPA
jgi:hypothetical protein